MIPITGITCDTARLQLKTLAAERRAIKTRSVQLGRPESLPNKEVNYLPEVNRFPASVQFTTFHHALI